MSCHPHDGPSQSSSNDESGTIDGREEEVGTAAATANHSTADVIGNNHSNSSSSNNESTLHQTTPPPSNNGSIKSTNASSRQINNKHQQQFHNNNSSGIKNNDENNNNNIQNNNNDSHPSPSSTIDSPINNNTANKNDNDGPTTNKRAFVQTAITYVGGVVSNVVSSAIDFGRDIIGDGKRRKTNNNNKNNQVDNDEVDNNAVGGNDKSGVAGSASFASGDSVRRSIGDADTTSNTLRIQSNNVEGGQSSGEDGTMSSTIRISSNNNAEGDQPSGGNSRTRRYDDKRMYTIQHGASLVVRGESTALALRTRQQLPEDAENAAKRQHLERADRVRRNREEYNQEIERIQHVLGNELVRIRGMNAGMASEIRRASAEITSCQHQLSTAQANVAKYWVDVGRVRDKLNRLVVSMDALDEYQSRVKNGLAALNEIETRLNFVKGEEHSKLQSATLRRDEAKHVCDLLLAAIQSNTTRGRSIAEDISKVRAEICMNEQELIDAKQLESHNKLRVETIEHEMNMERTLHEDAVMGFETKAREMDEAKVKIAQSMEEKKAMIETKKAELKKIWEKCTELRKSEGHDVLPEPKWGTEQAPSLDVARVQLRVSHDESALDAKKSELESLRKDVSDLNDDIAGYTSKAAKKHTEAEALRTAAENTHAQVSVRKADIAKAVEAANIECQEVAKLRESINNLTVRVKLLAEIDDAKRMATISKKAYKRAQKDANDFTTLPDEELAMEMKRLDEMEKKTIESANHERDELIQMEPILEKLKLDFDSDVPLEEQKKEGMNFLREHYRKLIEAAMSERAERVKHAREAYLKELEVDVVLSTADIRSRRFECDMGDLCQHTACCIMSNTSFSCLDCCPKSFVSVAPVMHDEHREAILHSCTSIIDECVFDKHVPPPSLCQHFWCRQVVLAHLKEGSTQHLQYCSCGAIVCEECFNSDECVDNAIYDSRAWNNTDNDDDADDEPVSLRWNNLQDQYESVNYSSDKSGYKGHVGGRTTPQYNTSYYGTTAEASIQLTAHHYAQGWNLPQGSITDLADFMQKWLNESAIVGDSPSAPATLKGRLSSSLSESLDFIERQNLHVRI